MIYLKKFNESVKPEFDAYLKECYFSIFDDFDAEFAIEPSNYNYSSNKNNIMYRIFIKDSSMNVMSNDIKDTIGTKYSDIIKAHNKVKLVFPEYSLQFSMIPGMETDDEFFESGVTILYFPPGVEKFDEDGFVISKDDIIRHIDKLGFYMAARRPLPLGSHHPGQNSSENKEYFSNALTLYTYDSNFNLIETFWFDERGFNSMHPIVMDDRFGDRRIKAKKPISIWLLEQFENMKKSDKSYGFGKKEGTRHLYVHDFMNWIYEHQNEFKP